MPACSRGGPALPVALRFPQRRRGRRRARARRWRRSSTPPWRADLRQAAGGAEYRRRRQRHLDRRGRHAGRLRHRPGQRPAGRLGRRGTPASAFDRDGALAARRRGRSRRAGPAAGASVLRPPGARNRSTGWISPPRWRQRPGRAVAGRRRGDPGRLHRRRGRRAPACPSRRGAGWYRRRPAQPGDHGARCATRCRRPGRAGRGGRLGRRRAGSAVLRLPRRARGARPAAQLSRHHRRAAARWRRGERLRPARERNWKTADRRARTLVRRPSSLPALSRRRAPSARRAMALPT